jgi:hypothetical protein
LFSSVFGLVILRIRTHHKDRILKLFLLALEKNG